MWEHRPRLSPVCVCDFWAISPPMNRYKISLYSFRLVCCTVRYSKTDKSRANDNVDEISRYFRDTADSDSAVITVRVCLCEFVYVCVWAAPPPGQIFTVCLLLFWWDISDLLNISERTDCFLEELEYLHVCRGLINLFCVKSDGDMNVTETEIKAI